MHGVFSIEVLPGQRCGDRRERVPLLTNPPVVRRLLVRTRTVPSRAQGTHAWIQRTDRCRSTARAAQRRRAASNTVTKLPQAEEVCRLINARSLPSPLAASHAFRASIRGPKVVLSPPGFLRKSITSRSNSPSSYTPRNSRAKPPGCDPARSGRARRCTGSRARADRAAPDTRTRAQFPHRSALAPARVDATRSSPRPSTRQDPRPTLDLRTLFTEDDSWDSQLGDTENSWAALFHLLCNYVERHRPSHGPRYRNEGRSLRTPHGRAGAGVRVSRSLDRDRRSVRSCRGR